jgi:8-oxo-dGTP pyrophosphatase MutT (NUDIX family)
MTSLLRHIRACNTAVLPGRRLPWRIRGAVVGWLKPDLARALSAFPVFDVGQDMVELRDPEGLDPVVRALVAQGHFRWRDEAFDVREVAAGPVLARIDRGALPAFGVMAEGVHVNGVVRSPDGVSMWIARRSASKQLDPGKLDHMVAGGVPAGLSPDCTVVKEAAEEAGLPADLAGTAVRHAVLRYAMERPEGLRRDRLYCYDLDVPGDFVPRPTDGEVHSFDLWPVARVLKAVRETDDFKFNVNLVLIDFFLRHGMIPEPEAIALRSLLDADDDH